MPREKLTPIEPINIPNTDMNASGTTHPLITFQTPSKIHSSGNNMRVGTFRIADFCLIIGQEKYPVVNANTAELNGNFEIRPFSLSVNKLHTSVLSVCGFAPVCGLGINAPNITTTKHVISRPPK